MENAGDPLAAFAGAAFDRGPPHPLAAQHSSPTTTTTTTTPNVSHRKCPSSSLRTALSPRDEKLIYDVTKHLENMPGMIKQLTDYYENKIENLNNHIKLMSEFMADQQKRDNDQIKKLKDELEKAKRRS